MTTEVARDDWGGREVRGEAFTDTAFVECDLSEVTTEGAVFDRCTFRGTRFNVSSHTATAFVNCLFERCSFFDSAFTGCKLVGSRFVACSFDLLKVEGGDWSFTTLARADLSSAAFTGVRMREADLRGARATCLRDVDLSAAQLEEADLSGCDLRGADLTSLVPSTVRLAGAVITAEQAVLLAIAQGLEVRPA